MLGNLIDPDVDPVQDRAADWFADFRRDAEAMGVDWLTDHDLDRDHGHWGLWLCGTWVSVGESAASAIVEAADALVTADNWYDDAQALAKTCLYLASLDNEDFGPAYRCLQKPRNHAANFLATWREAEIAAKRAAGEFLSGK